MIDDKFRKLATISGAQFNIYKCPIAQFSNDGELFATVNVSNGGHAVTLYASEYSWNCVQVKNGNNYFN